MPISETAYAKINLALHVRRRRDDGYHELETLFAFVDSGDRLVARAAPEDRLEVAGEFAVTLDDPSSNIAMLALGKLPRPGTFAITLEKNIPVAAGLGGGSADAGAVFRIIREQHGLPDDWVERAAKLGADVPACVESITCIGRGTGTELQLVESDLAGMATLLVNPRIALSTGPVFAGWDGEDLGPMPTGTVSEIALGGRNDLEPSAIAICPEIAKVLAALRGTDPFLARMSGSGASCFALFECKTARDAAALGIAAEHPGWWQMKGNLR